MRTTVQGYQRFPVGDESTEAPQRRGKIAGWRRESPRLSRTLNQNRLTPSVRS